MEVTSEKSVEEGMGGGGGGVVDICLKKFKIYMIYKSKTMRTDCLGENLICY